MDKSLTIQDDLIGRAPSSRTLSLKQHTSRCRCLRRLCGRNSLDRKRRCLRKRSRAGGLTVLRDTFHRGCEGEQKGPTRGVYSKQYLPGDEALLVQAESGEARSGGRTGSRLEVTAERAPRRVRVVAAVGKNTIYYGERE
jgi:hypothetical protein